MTAATAKRPLLFKLTRYQPAHCSNPAFLPLFFCSLKQRAEGAVHARHENCCRSLRAARWTAALRAGVDPLPEPRRSLCGHCAWAAKHGKDQVEVGVRFELSCNNL